MFEHPANIGAIMAVLAAVAELRTLLADRGNFRIDGRSMKREAAVRWSELSDRLQTLRRDLRASYARQKGVA